MTWTALGARPEAAPTRSQPVRPTSTLSQISLRRPASPSIRSSLPLAAPGYGALPYAQAPALSQRASVGPRQLPTASSGTASPNRPTAAPSLSRRPSLTLLSSRSSSVSRSPSPVVSRHTPAPAPSPPVYRPPHARLSGSSGSGSSSSRSVSPTTSRSSVPPQTSVLEVHGDSFSGVFTLLGSQCRVRKYSGASARGLNNPNSSRQVAAELLSRLENARPQQLALCFGGVDFSVNYLWQLRARGAAAAGPGEWVNKVASDYASFLSQRIVPWARKNGSRVYVAGVLPPVVNDAYLEACSDKYIEKTGGAILQPLGRTAHAHDLATRTAMHNRCNALLSSFCLRYPDCLTFVDITADLVDRSGRVRQEFCDAEDPTNIHLLWETTLPIWMRHLPPLTPFASQFSSQAQLARLDSSLARFKEEKRERVRVRGASWNALDVRGGPSRV